MKLVSDTWAAHAPCIASHAELDDCLSMDDYALISDDPYWILYKDGEPYALVDRAMAEAFWNWLREIHEHR